MEIRKTWAKTLNISIVVRMQSSLIDFNDLSKEVYFDHFHLFLLLNGLDQIGIMLKINHELTSYKINMIYLFFEAIFF